MSYGPRDLDEIPTSELHAELERRNNLMQSGICPYCKHPVKSHTCRWSGKDENGPRMQDYHFLSVQEKRECVA